MMGRTRCVATHCATSIPMTGFVPANHHSFAPTEGLDLSFTDTAASEMDGRHLLMLSRCGTVAQKPGMRKLVKPRDL